MMVGQEEDEDDVDIEAEEEEVYEEEPSQEEEEEEELEVGQDEEEQVDIVEDEEEEVVEIAEEEAYVEEDYNVEGKDLFDSDDNDDYHRTTAVSRFRPPRLPPPTFFPRKFPRTSDFREAAGRHSGRHGDWGGRHGERGGSHGESGGRQRDRGQHRHSGLGGSGGSQRWHNHRDRDAMPSYDHPRGSRIGVNSSGGLVVAEMKLGASGHNDATLRLKCPPFQEPSQIACYSRSGDGNVHLDDRCLRRFRHNILNESGADLNEGYDTFIEKREDSESSGFGDLLSCLRSKRVIFDNIHFVTYRNNLNKILGTAYNRLDAWEMGVHKRRGTIYLDVHKLPEPPQTELQHRRCYWGYSFEQVATESHLGHTGSELSRHSANGGHKRASLATESVAVDANVEFCVVLRTKLGPHRIIMGAEMDCYDVGKDGKKTFIELKTSRELENRTIDRFEREKLLKFWIQSFLAGVPRIVCGYRNDEGMLLRSEVMSTKDITQRVKAKHYWEGGVCLAFADQVLCWLYGSVKENEDYKLRFLPNGNRLELLRADSCPDVIVNHVEGLEH